ncbi:MULTISPECIES: replication initiator protein A [Sphingobium]|uniref:Plasmid replication initiator protein n=1 Tax=Sphingobium indicum (strain DSM 16413 / CCM 7287 / MTCC 6362 / UT26 / NBRC 101211 / UT26S) TaxID=452662 RepID=D4Z2L2_SPHIU|nr:replication initiator protein A [Sphingobium indicum]BAI96844.1 plasmid replication initiator protein [Sphingobium indicum UT26S]
MAARHRSPSERGQLDLFRALPGDFAPRDAQDLMAYPFFSLSKSHRIAPIDFVSGNVTIRVEAVPDHGMATIWDADILIWAASQIVEARDTGLLTSRLMVATPYEILKFIGRGTSMRDYQRLKAALDRLQSTTVATSIRQPAEGRRHRFSWINEWKERTDRNGKPDGIEMIVPDWFYRAVLDNALVLTIDRAYFDLTGGLDRWLYRLVRKHGGRQRNGWRFDFRHLHQKSGSLSPFKRFAFELRDIIRRQPLPGYTLFLEVEIGGRTLLAFEPTPPCGQAVDGVVPSGTVKRVPSGTGPSCHREPKHGLTHGAKTRIRALNLESNQESNFEERAREVENLIRGAADALSVSSKTHRRRPAFGTANASKRAASDTPKLPFDDSSGGAR